MGFVELGLNELFDQISNFRKRTKVTADVEFSLRMSILNVADEQRVVDMLDSGSKPFRIEETSEDGFLIPSSAMRLISSVKDGLEMLEKVSWPRLNLGSSVINRQKRNSSNKMLY